MKNYEIKRGGITFCVDYYVELLGVLSILCEDQDAICDAGRVRCNKTYVRQVEAYFGNADCEELTKLLALFSDDYNFNYDAPVALMLMLSNGAEIDKEELFRHRKPIPDGLFERFLTLLAEFEQSSNFAAFYQRHLAMYQRLAEHFIADYERYHAHEFLRHFFADNGDTERVINLMVGITNANYGAAVGNKIYANIRPYDETRYGMLPDFSFDPLYFTTLIVHEFAHSYVNPMVAKHRSVIEGISPEKYGAALDMMCYGDSVETLICETVIRAIECLYVREHFWGYYEEYVSSYIEEGYTEIRDVIDALYKSEDMGKVVAIFR